MHSTVNKNREMLYIKWPFESSQSRIVKRQIWLCLIQYFPNSFDHGIFPPSENDTLAVPVLEETYFSKGQYRVSDEDSRNERDHLQLGKTIMEKEYFELDPSRSNLTKGTLWEEKQGREH